jgi:hypothetical protein
MPTAPRQSRTLTSWKEIATYLGKGVRTVQRWEQELGLPVRRPASLEKGMVFATPQDLDLWLRSQWKRRPGAPAKANGGADNVTAAMEASRKLRRANRDIVQELLRSVEELRQQCDVLVGSASRKRETKRRRT